MVECFECGDQVDEEDAQNVMVKAGETDDGSTVGGFQPHCSTCFDEVTV